ALAPSEHQDNVVGERAGECGMQLALGSGIEVDRDVAAEDEPPLTGRRALANEVALLPAEPRPHRRRERDALVDAASREREVLLQQIAPEQKGVVERAQPLQQ